MLLKNLNLENKFIFIYSGSLGTYNLIDEMLDFFNIASSIIKNSHFLILTHTKEIFLEKIEKDVPNKEKFTVLSVERDKLFRFYSLGDVGLIFRRRSFTARASSPTKFAEYLASGIPVVSGPDIGDLAEIIKKYNIGTILTDYSKDAYRKALDEIIYLTKDRLALSQRCRRAAEEVFSISKAVEKYLSIYQRLYSDVINR
jgi:glycosyltransferase involved in cell wall biosynthesis